MSSIYGDGVASAGAVGGAGLAGAGVGSLIGGAIGGYVGSRFGDHRHGGYNDGYGHRGGCGCGCGGSCNCSNRLINNGNIIDGHYRDGYRGGYYGDGDAWYYQQRKLDNIEKDIWRTDKNVDLGNLAQHKDAIINKNDICCCIDKGTDRVLEAMKCQEIKMLESKLNEKNQTINRLETERYIDHKFDKVYAENGRINCELKEVAGIASHAVGAVHNLKNALTHECVKPSGTMTFPNFCEEKHFRNETERSLHHIFRDVERLNRDFEDRRFREFEHHRHHNHEGHGKKTG